MGKLLTKDFNLDHTLSCGQVFRWHKHDGAWYGFINRIPVKLIQENGSLIYEGKVTNNDLTKYFNLDLDYIKVIKTFPPHRILILALKRFWGLRIIKQDPFECLMSYILSSQNNIKRINKMVDELSRQFGKKMKFDGREVYAFPSLTDLKGSCSNDFRSCRLGFRDRYLEDAVKKLVSKEIKLEKISKMPYPKAMEELMKVKGIGKKVASCILLFGYNKYESFPVDVWIERALQTYFPGKDASYFGKYAGYAQEFLYMYIRGLKQRK
jgi:N-glycosylase/DNA lyase